MPRGTCFVQSRNLLLTDDEVHACMCACRTSVNIKKLAYAVPDSRHASMLARVDGAQMQQTSVMSHCTLQVLQCTVVLIAIVGYYRRRSRPRVSLHPFTGYVQRAGIVVHSELGIQRVYCHEEDEDTKQDGIPALILVMD